MESDPHPAQRHRSLTVSDRWEVGAVPGIDSHDCGGAAADGWATSGARPERACRNLDTVSPGQNAENLERHNGLGRAEHAAVPNVPGKKNN